MSQPVRIVVEMAPNGEIRMGGPLDNKVLCLGLLDIARQIVHEHGKDQAKEPSIVVPAPGTVNRINGRG